ncbi:hypothetical protein CEXT_76851 [Caerostris extrusa]|uniref:Uncharacterized protein n=1 Tax=Caerostris extrusa TaxID=172846 RepID=A0AAV4PAM6_CAEEX|nr:hypothetical protein CEXT_76851 [Caerostris extrusa]
MAYNDVFQLRTNALLKDTSSALLDKSRDHSSWSKPLRDYRNLDLSGKLDVYPPGAFLVVLKEESCTTLLAIRVDIPYEGISCPDLMKSFGMSAVGHWIQGMGRKEMEVMDN